jgi:hypothetical protein
MVPEPTSEAWVQMRYKYEHTDQPVDDISAEHGISPGTLRDRVRRWGWARRRPPVPREGPPPAPAPQIDAAAPPLPTVGAFDSVAPSLAAAPQVETAAPCAASAPQVAAGEDAGACGEGGDSTITPRLQKRGCPRPARHRGDRREARHGGRASARAGTGRPRACRADANLAGIERSPEPAPGGCRRRA